MLHEESTPQNQAKCSPQESHFHNCENIEKQVTTQLVPDSRYSALVIFSFVIVILVFF